ncbi:Transmembrane protein 53 [Chamberlinius hualienensis]
MTQEIMSKNTSKMKSTLCHPMETLANIQGQVLIDEVVVNVRETHHDHNVPFLADPSAACSSSTGGRSSSSRSSSMAVDDLEYHITFPASHNECSPHQFDHKVDVTGNNGRVISKNNCNNNTNGCAVNDESDDGIHPQFVRENDNMEPVVVLLGWYGCQDKHLAKYSKIYENLGCITIRFLPKADIIIYQPDSLRSIASKLFEVVDDFNLSQHKIILHIFSNGGCYVYRHICQLLTTPEDDSVSSPNGSVPLKEGKQNQPPTRTLNIEGSIFDSCPAVTSPLHLFRAIAAATTNGNLVYRWIRSAVLMFAVIFAAVMEFLLGFLWSESKRVSPQALWNGLAKDRSRCPQLFLYSKADEICHYKSIKNFAEERKKCGVDVGEVCWEDSPHVKHFLMHRNEYLYHVFSFLNKCLKMDVTLPEVKMTSINLENEDATADNDEQPKTTP